MWPFNHHPKKLQERKLLQQWRRERRRALLQELPLRALLWKLQCDTEASQEESRGRMGSLLDRLKRWLPIAKKTGSEKKLPEPSQKNSRPSRTRSLPPFLVQLLRRLAILALCQLVDLLQRSFLGKLRR